MGTMDEERMFYHAVALGAGGNYAALLRQRKRHATWREAYEKSGGAPTTDPEKEYRELDRQNIHLALPGDPEYPERLREIPHPPFGIYIRGQLHEQNASILAIVGTRRATPDGKGIARRFSAHLTRAGFSVASGLAFGVDAAAHEGCLDSGGKTIAILAGGLANVYPKNNAPLAQKILGAGGALISEYPPDLPALPHRFLERNRIVSGLAQGVLVVESPERSGSLATARFAFEQNRDVFVVPGPITHPNFKGSHALIRQGAELVTQPEDILESYGITKEKEPPRRFAGTPEESAVLAFLSSCAVPADIDKIIDMARLEPRIANQAVSSLFIKGVIKESGEGYMVN
jgi:DNA processing protein